MAKEFIIGRNGDQPFQITSEGVSSRHASITIGDDGSWLLRDLGSTNGTFVRNAGGDFRQVQERRICEDSVIRLGSGTHRSFIFTAHRVIAPDGDYSYEFKQLKKLLSEQEAREEKLRGQIKVHNYIAGFAGVAALLLMLGIEEAYRAVTHQGLLEQLGPMVSMVVRMGLMGVAAAVVKMCFSGDNDRLRDTIDLRKKFLLCPRCGKVIGETEINNMQCPFCKAS